MRHPADRLREAQSLLVEKKGEATMELASRLKSNLVTKAVKNVRRGTRKEEIEGTMFRSEVTLDLQRSRLFTESFRQTDGEALVLRRAKALAHLLRNMRVFIRDWERIVGHQTENPSGLYHPIDMNWKSVKRLVRTEAGKTLLDEAGMKELDEICAYWKGKSMSDRVQDLFTGDLGKYWRYEGTFLWLHGSELGIPDYEELFRTGLRGRIRMARDRLEEIDRSIPPDYVDQKEFLQSVIIALEAVIDFAGRYAAHAREKAASETDPERKQRLEVPGGHACASCERTPSRRLQCCTVLHREHIPQTRHAPSTCRERPQLARGDLQSFSRAAYP